MLTALFNCKLSRERFLDDLGMPPRNANQCLRGAGGRSPSLLPFLQRPFRNSERLGKLALRQPGRLPRFGNFSEFHCVTRAALPAFISRTDCSSFSPSASPGGLWVSYD